VAVLGIVIPGVTKAKHLNKVSVENADNFVSIWRAPKKDKLEFEQGLNPTNFPGEPGHHPDGKVYFGKERAIAEEYSKHGLYEDNIVEIQMPADDYNRIFQQYQKSHDSTPIGTQLGIPRDLIDQLNGYPRVRH
jgi:hypothetical protein